MLIPRFSLRLLLCLTTVAAACFFVVHLAIRGHGWAIGVSAALAACVLAVCAHALTFLLVWAVAAMGERFTRRSIAGSPFASAGPPPQIVPPQEIE